jgi:hypothetical protein
VTARHPEPSASRLSAMGLCLRCAVRPSASGLPRPRPRRAPGPCRIAGRPAVALPSTPHLAPRRDAESVSCDAPGVGLVRPIGSHRPGP